MNSPYKIALILDNVRSAHNVGSLFRTADCFGISKIFIAGYTPAPKHPTDKRLPHIANKLHNQISKTALGAETTVEFEVLTTTKDAIACARRQNYLIASLEQSSASLALNDYVAQNNVALIVGNEVNGVDEWTLNISDVILEIKQSGSKESLNVANAAAVAMYALSTNYKTNNYANENQPQHRS